MSSLTDYLLREYLQTRQQTVNNQHQLMTEDRQFRMRQQEMGNQVMADAAKNFMQMQAQNALKLQNEKANTISAGKVEALKADRVATSTQNTNDRIAEVNKYAAIAGIDPSTIDINDPKAVGALEGQAALVTAQTRAQQPAKAPGRTPAGKLSEELKTFEEGSQEDLTLAKKVAETNDTRIDPDIKAAAVRATSAFTKYRQAIVSGKMTFKQATDAYARDKDVVAFKKLIAE